MLSAIQHGGPVIYLEHKLLSGEWLELLGAGGRKTVHFDVPQDGACGPVPRSWSSVPFGRAAVRCPGRDLTIVSLAVGVHRSLEAAAILQDRDIAAGVLDLRTVWPLDKQRVCEAVTKTGHLLVVDEDYEAFGLSGELAATLLDEGIQAKYARVCTQDTIPYSRQEEDRTLPNVDRIVDAALRLLG